MKGETFGLAVGLRKDVGRESQVVPLSVFSRKLSVRVIC